MAVRVFERMKASRCPSLADALATASLRSANEPPSARRTKARHARIGSRAAACSVTTLFPHHWLTRKVRNRRECAGDARVSAQLARAMGMMRSRARAAAPIRARCFRPVVPPEPPLRLRRADPRGQGLYADGAAATAAAQTRRCLCSSPSTASAAPSRRWSIGRRRRASTASCSCSRSNRRARRFQRGAVLRRGDARGRGRRRVPARRGRPRRRAACARPRPSPSASAGAMAGSW